MEKKIVIFGAGKGLSQSVARLFGQQGFSVSLVARSEERLKQLVEELKQQGISADYAVCDLANEQSLTAVMQHYEHAGLPEVVLFNAFMYYEGGFETETWEHLKTEFDIDFGAAFNIVKRWLPLYREAGRGNLFFTGGGLALYPMEQFLGVSVTKAALRAMVYATAKEVENTGIHLATVTVQGNIGGDDPKYAPDAIARQYWTLYEQQPSERETEICY